LIAGLFDTDGSISVNEDTKKFSITFYQTNLNLIKELKSQLYKLGIIATINIRKAADYNIGGKIRHSKQSYRLEIKRKQSVIRFYENIPLNISYKKKNLEKIYNIVLNKKDSEHNLISGAIQSKIVRITPIGI
jgi:intein-encoded DNA endonuclease-like protein